MLLIDVFLTDYLSLLPLLLMKQKRKENLEYNKKELGLNKNLLKNN
jgi:hypothetical protein